MELPSLPPLPVPLEEWFCNTTPQFELLLAHLLAQHKARAYTLFFSHVYFSFFYVYVLYLEILLTSEKSIKFVG